MSAPDLGIQGPWYAYADSIGKDGLAASSDCVQAGHAVADCAAVTVPAAPYTSFPNDGTGLHTSGVVERVAAKVGLVGCPSSTAACDYGAMWGAGIAVDLNNPSGTALPYDSTQLACQSVVGFAFDIDQVPSTQLKVEVTTADYPGQGFVYLPTGGDLHGPLVVGHNRVLWSDFQDPTYLPGMFDPSRIVSIAFHVPTSTDSGPTPYDFKISNFAPIFGVPAQ